MYQILLLLIFLQLVSCSKGFGSRESEYFKVKKTLAFQSFQDLKQNFLIPYGCTASQCHPDFNDENNIMKFIRPKNPDDSTLYIEVASGRMPKGGNWPKVTEEDLELLRNYILALNPSANPPIPVLEATYRSLEYHLFKPYGCFKCHGDNPSDNELSLNSYEKISQSDVRESIYWAMYDQDMPPIDQGYSSINEDLLKVYEKWKENPIY